MMIRMVMMDTGFLPSEVSDAPCGERPVRFVPLTRDAASESGGSEGMPYAARRRRRSLRPKRRRERLDIAGISIVAGVVATSAFSNDGMWRSIWDVRHVRHEHSGTDMPVFEQTVIPVP